MFIRHSLLSTLTLLPLLGASVNAACAPNTPTGPIKSGTVTINQPAGAPTTAPPAGGDPGNSGTNTGNVEVILTSVAHAWYTSWHNQYQDVDSINWDNLNSIGYAFVIPSEDGSLMPVDNEELLNKLVQTGHSKNASISVSIGGWTGSRYFSPIMADEKKRATFLQAVVGLVKTYNLDGIDMDWEYVNDVNKGGLTCNNFPAEGVDDGANFLTFLKSLRDSEVGKQIKITAAVPIKPFNAKDGTPSTNVSEYATVLDWIEIMAYDIRVPSIVTKAGPHAAIDDSCAPEDEKLGSAASAVTAWTNAGFPPQKIVLGVPAYGRAFSVKPSDALDKDGKIVTYPPTDGKTAPVGDSWDVQANAQTKDVCGDPDQPSGMWNFVNLHASGFLEENGTLSVGQKATGGYDNCTATAMLYITPAEGATAGSMVYYDSEESSTQKGQFIAKNGLRGFAMWEAAGDYQGKLAAALQNGIYS